MWTPSERPRPHPPEPPGRQAEAPEVPLSFAEAEAARRLRASDKRGRYRDKEDRNQFGKARAILAKLAHIWQVAHTFGK